MRWFRKWIVRNSLILSVLVLYFIFHLINLTLLPPYNDESIYLDWAWSYTHMPGHLYDSLLDAKQPFLLWVFAFFQNFIADPLFAGRLVSVLIGAGTIVGIFAVAQKLFDKKHAFFSALLFIFIPIFVFYNRQALMEASIACIGIWAFYFLLLLFQKPRKKYAVWLGTSLGIGFFIKSSTLLFIPAIIFLFLFRIIKKKQTELLYLSGFLLLTFFAVTALLFISPLFWQTFGSNSRYSLTLAELIRLPFTLWWEHLVGFFEIGFFFVTPFVFLCGVIGLFVMKQKKVKDSGLFIVFFVSALLFEIILGRYQNQRYLMPFLPFLIISAIYFVLLIRQQIFRRVVVGFLLVIPLLCSFYLIVNPDAYIMQMAKFSRYSNTEHVRGQMAGYGVKEAMQYITEHSVSSVPTMVFIALNAGNPESAVDVYSNMHLQLYPLHIDARFFPGIEQVDCLTSAYPVFFVTRYDQRVGMDRFFTLAKVFSNPDGEYWTGIYTLKKDCEGNTFSLSDMYGEPMKMIFQMKSGK